MIHLDLTESEAKALDFAIDKQLYHIQRHIDVLEKYNSTIAIQARNKWHVLYAKLTMIREKLS